MATKETPVWRTPAPLWQRAISDGTPAAGGLVPTRFSAPTLLRFDSDAFMDELQAVLDRDPAGLAAQVARAETWRQPAAGWSDSAAGARSPITLYQPVQSRFYLATASLVCERPGLPDRKVKPREREQAAFLMRRLVAREGVVLDPADPETYDEYGWFGDRRQGLWLPLDDGTTAHPDEERLPLFPLSYAEGHWRRRLWAGLIPVGSRETYEAGARRSLRAPSAGMIASDPLGDPRVATFSATLVEALAALAALPGDPQTPEREGGIRDSLVHTCLDLGLFLEAELPALWVATDSTDLGTAAALYARLTALVADGRHWLDLARNARAHEAQILAGETDAAGILIVDQAQAFTPAVIAVAASTLLGTEDTSGPYPQYPLVADLVTALGDPRAAAAGKLVEGWAARLADWPGDDGEAQALTLTLLLELADWLAREIPLFWQAVEADDPAGLAGTQLSLWNRFGAWSLAGIDGRTLLRDAATHRRDILLGQPSRAIALVAADPTSAALSTGLSNLIDGGLAASLGAALPAANSGGSTPPAEPPAEAQYILRCVLDRPACVGLRPPLVSAPSRPFRLASFFDPDAPTRRLELRMPVDTSIAGLRKFPKGVSVLISNQLRAQMERIQQIRIDAATNEVEVVGNEASFDLGLVCSFSIPIVTICALILLMIVVQILNIVFFWLPYFVICLPLNLGGRS